jgi:hypothetical protein
MKRGFVAIVGAMLITFATTTGAHASTLTFDDISIGGHIPDNYGGLQWGPFAFYLAPSDNMAFFADSGYDNGLVSGNFVAYNNSDQVFSVSGPTFDFNSAYLTAAWNTGLNITVTGMLGATTLYSQTVVVNTTAPTFFTFNYLGIDQLTFSSSGGVSDLFPQYGDDGHHFVIDNITINEATAVPDAGSTLAMFGLGMLGLGAIRRKLSF